MLKYLNLIFTDMKYVLIKKNWRRNLHSKFVKYNKSSNSHFNWASLHRGTNHNQKIGPTVFFFPVFQIFISFPPVNSVFSVVRDICEGFAKIIPAVYITWFYKFWGLQFFMFKKRKYTMEWSNEKSLNAGRIHVEAIWLQIHKLIEVNSVHE